jgi:hypothetical protein
MPNWCSCDLEILGPQASIDKIRSICKAAHDAEDPTALDLCNLFPCPPELNNVRSGGTTSKDGVYLTNWYDTPDGPVPVDEESLRARFGASNWYDWCLSNWGTKWDFSLSEGPVDDPALFPGPDDAYLSGTFDTAWAPPIAFLEKVAADFPECSFALRYFECGMAFQGLVIFKDGSESVNYEGKYFGSRGG